MSDNLFMEVYRFALDFPTSIAIHGKSRDGFLENLERLNVEVLAIMS